MGGSVRTRYVYIYYTIHTCMTVVRKNNWQPAVVGAGHARAGNSSTHGSGGHVASAGGALSRALGAGCGGVGEGASGHGGFGSGSKVVKRFFGSTRAHCSRAS
jgi:hypothetical protein